MMSKIIAFLLITIITITPVLAEPASEPDNLLARIAELEAQLAALTAALNTPPFVDLGTVQRQRQEAIQLERFMFQAKYYGACLTIAHTDLLTYQHELTKKQLNLEYVLYDLGLSTQNNINDIHTTLNSLSRQIELNNELIRPKRRLIETRRNREGYEFIGNFRIPVRNNALVSSAETLRENLLRNNTALIVLNSHLNQAAWQGASWQEVRLLEEQRDLLTRQLEIAALTSWNNYQNAKSALALTRETLPLLQARQTLTEEMYTLGEISSMEKANILFAIRVEKFQADQSAIALAMAIAEVNFMSQGVI
ncbi:MAG: TolC family protein [Defluviitaleaceae bacterium]|nr:TolC family protein [Defluviitaleaceae bacterium]